MDIDGSIDRQGITRYTTRTLHGPAMLDPSIYLAPHDSHAAQFRDAESLTTLSIYHRSAAGEEATLSTAEYTARFQLQEHLQQAVGQAWAESAVEIDAQVGLPPLPLIAKALLARSALEQEARHAELQSEHERLKQLCASRDPELLASFESGARQ